MYIPYVSQQFSLHRGPKDSFQALRQLLYGPVSCILIKGLDELLFGGFITS